ncbi:MAG: hypothetical protein LBG60_16810 [Bifidobacteriaceae bacterium]|jgi:hypothetical protein|nr:hypothetical protein [Bifidobacteriaceae bacterium]
MIAIYKLAELGSQDATQLYLRQGEHTSWRVVTETARHSRFTKVEWFSKNGWVEVVSGRGWDGDNNRLRLLEIAVNVVWPGNHDHDIQIYDSLPQAPEVDGYAV